MKLCIFCASLLLRWGDRAITLGTKILLRYGPVTVSEACLTTTAIPKMRRIVAAYDTGGYAAARRVYMEEV